MVRRLDGHQGCAGGSLKKGSRREGSSWGRSRRPQRGARTPALGHGSHSAVKPDRLLL